MKKFISALLLAVCLVIPALAQEDSSSENTPIWDHGDNVSSMSYRSAPIYKIMDQTDSYVVLYQKQNLKVGTAVIPKKWAKLGEERKLFFRNKPADVEPYMTVFYKDGEFYKVLLTVSASRGDSVWGVVPNGTKVEGTDTDTLSVEF